MKKVKICLYMLAFIFFGEKTTAQIVDKVATTETKNLLKNLRTQLTKGIMFGHQDDLAYGVSWKYEAGRSDVRDVTGEYPAVYGWEIAGLEKDSKVNIDSVPFTKMREYIKEGYSRGGVITISWHLNHPVTGKSAWDTTHGGVSASLPGGSAHTIYTSWLDKVANFALSLKGSKGELIPVIFRPFHELTGNWFWWTKNTCTPDEFKALWKFTVDYLTNKKQVHNFIYMYNTSGFESKQAFLERYPGDDYADMISFDSYQYGDPLKDNSFVDGLKNQLSMLVDIAKEHNKIPALGETGYEAIPYADWWTKTLYKGIESFNISYVLVWRNFGRQANGTMHYYAPYKGQISAADFKQFYAKKNILFEKETSQQNLYKYTLTIFSPF